MNPPKPIRRRVAEKCVCDQAHPEKVIEVAAKMPEAEALFELADLFKTFGDSTRIKILWALDVSELCVCDISAVLNMTQSATSHQLRILKQANLVTSRKAGKQVFYSLKDEHVRQIFDQGLDHIYEALRGGPRG